ncbi:MAG: 50S ribosomal protein L25 [Candidatus Liptonbacteria bacterium]|nr:50S ribosomal protein L25 [Candidatus Liptonbacteria bacterium]
MTSMDLKASTREKFGKAVKVMRREGFVPAELYGRGVKNLHLAVPTKEFNKVFKEAGSNTVVNLLVGSEKHPALIYDVVKDYLTDDVAHVDFYQVRMDEKIKAKVPLAFVGESGAVKEKGAIINKSMFEIEVEALPGDLPHRFDVDISALDDLNKSVYVKDLKVSKNVKILVDPETVIVTATPPLAEEVKVEAPVDVTAVKVETEEKKAERVAEKTEKAEKTESSK